MKRVCAVVLLSFGLATSAAAQRTTGEIIGKVVDESGSVLPGVTVTLRGAGVAGAPTVVTSETGVYRFPVLPPGTYSVEYALTGFGRSSARRFRSPSASVVELDVTLKVGALEESVTVSGESPVVNVASSEVSTNYNREWVENAPVRRFSYFDLINSAPGVSATSNVGQSTAAQSLGNSTNENSYQIDGTDISSTPWPNTDAIEEVEVLQLGASAEYGNVQGAVFNIVTRQGGNAFHGDANFYLQTDGLTGRNTTDAQSTAGGPYHRDTWRDATRPGVGTVHQGQVLVLRLAAVPARLGLAARRRSEHSGVERRAARVLEVQLQHHAEPSADARVSRRLLLHPGHRDRASRRRARSTSATATTRRRTWSTRACCRTRPSSRRGYSGFCLHSSTDPNEAGQRACAAAVRGPGHRPHHRRHHDWNENRSWRYGYQAKLSHLADELPRRQPRLEARRSVHRRTAATPSPAPNDMFLTYSVTRAADDRHDAAAVSPGRRSRSAIGHLRRRHLSARRAPSINLGVRYDYSKGLFPALPFLDAQGNPTGQMSAANDDVYHWNTFSPRVGINYKVNDSGKTVVKAHYGRYYKALEAAEFRPAVPSITTQFNFTVDAARQPRSTSCPVAAANLRIDPNFKSPYSDQYIVQFEQQLTTNLGLQVNYVHKSGGDYGGWQDIAGHTRRCRTSTTSASTRPARR